MSNNYNFNNNINNNNQYPNFNNQFQYSPQQQRTQNPTDQQQEQMNYQPQYMPVQQKQLLQQWQGNNGSSNNNNNNNFHQINDIRDEISSTGMTKSLQSSFISKVYGILSISVGITALFAFLAINEEGFRLFLINNRSMIYICFALQLIIIIALTCNRTLARTVPQNYIFFFLFVSLESYLVAYVCALIQNPLIVYEAFLMTTGAFIGLSLYACVSKEDYTPTLAAINGCCLVLIIAGFFLMFTHSQTGNLIYAVLSALMFCCYIVVDTQMMMGNKEYSFDVDDYIFAALNLYLDFVGLLLQLLQILAQAQNN